MASSALLHSAPPLHPTSTNHRKYKLHNHTKTLLFPCSSKSHLTLSHSSPSTNVGQRGFIIRAEAKKGAQSRWNSKRSTDDSNPRKEKIMSFLKKIEALIEGGPASEPKERSIGGPKKQPLEPKSKDKKGFRDIRSSGPLPNFDKFIRDESTKAVAPPPDFIAPPPDSVAPQPDYRPLSNFDKLIREAVAPPPDSVAPPPDYRPSRPTSRFVRRSPIPISNPAKEKTKMIPEEQLPSVILREALEQEMSGSDDMPVIMELKKSPESEQELEPKLDLEAMTIVELKDIAKARGLKGYSRFKKAKLVEILKDTSL